MYGELGLPPAEALGVDWCQLDHYLHGYERRCQRELAGHRVTATRIHNLFPGKEGPLSERDYLLLPLVDAAPPAPKGIIKSMDEWRAELAAQNAKTLAARAAQQHG